MGQFRILLIEENPIEAKFISSHLRQREYMVVETENTHEAISLLIDELPDLILLDSSRGEVTEFCRLIKQVSHIPIIIICENPRKFDELKYLESGADDFIIKPFSVEILSLRVKAVIKRRKAANQSASYQSGLKCLSM